MEKARKARSNEESQAQRHFILWWEIVGCRKFKLPACLLHSVPNGGFRNKITASIMKAEGQKRGVFDLKLNVARAQFHGLWIEMKTKDGVLSEHQELFKAAVNQQGYLAVVCRSAEAAQRRVEDYLNLL